MDDDTFTLLWFTVLGAVFFLGGAVYTSTAFVLTAMGADPGLVGGAIEIGFAATVVGLFQFLLAVLGLLSPTFRAVITRVREVTG